jgi:Transposase IS66 family
MRAAGHRLANFVNVSASQACELMALSLQVSISEPMIAQLGPPSTLAGEERILAIERAKVSRGSALAEAISYGLNHWQGLSCFLDDGRIEIVQRLRESLPMSFGPG